MATAATRPLIGPPIFKGTAEESVTEWLTCYDHVASMNAWDNDAKVKCLYLALDGDARKWYTTQILTGTPSSWDDWKVNLKQAFGSRHASEVAYLKLSSRTQLPFETPEQYFYDMLQLCARVDTTMREEDKLRHLFRGLRPEMIEKMALTNPTSCAEFLQTLQRLNQVSRMTQALWQSSSSAMLGATAPAPLQSHGSFIVPDSFIGPKQIYSAHCSLDSSGRPYVLPSFPAAAQVPQRDSATTRENAEDLKTIAASMQAMQSRLLSLEDKLSRAPTQWPQRNGRADDGRVVCHYCNRRGHILRQCQTRERDQQRERRGGGAPQQGRGNANGRV